MAAARPAVREVAGITVALVALSDSEPDWVAKEVAPGIFYVPIDATDRRAGRAWCRPVPMI